MARLPKKIEECPIKEAVFEIRYFSECPVDAIFGILYAAIKDSFTEEPVSLPVLQLPEAIRERDPNLKYQAYHKITKGNMCLNIGPRVLAFANSDTYEGWTEWSEFFYTLLEKIKTVEVLNKIERMGLRYINLFDGNIFDKVKLEVKINDRILREESTNLRTEIIDDDFVKILQIGNSVNIAKNDMVNNGSVIDIDILHDINDTSDFLANYRDVIEKAHVKEKELFFSLLEESFLEELKPDYGE